MAKGLTTSLIPIVFSLVLDATTASLGLGADVPASASAARLKVTFGNGTVSAEIAGVPLRRVMEEIGRLGGIEVRWAGAIGEEPISVAFADLPLREALERVLRTRNFALIGSADPASPHLRRIVILDSGRRPPLAAPVPAGKAGAIDPSQLVDEIVATVEPQAKSARMRAIEDLAVSAREDPGVRMALTQRANEETDEAAGLAAVQAESEAVPSWAAREESEGDGVTNETPTDGAPDESDLVPGRRPRRRLVRWARAGKRHLLDATRSGEK